MNSSSQEPQASRSDSDYSEYAVTVLIADDHAFFRDGVIGILGRKPAIRIVGAASNGHECVSMAITLRPRVILMDVQMPCTGGFAATREIRDASPTSKVIIFSMFEDSTLIRQAIDCGARGYLLKDTDVDQLCEAIIAVDRGALFFGPGPAQRLAKILSDSDGASSRLQQFANLSHREMEVLSLLARDLANKEIAEELKISLKTVRNHVSNVLAKLGAANRHEAGRIARNSQQGIR